METKGGKWDEEITSRAKSKTNGKANDVVIVFPGSLPHAVTSDPLLSPTIIIAT